MTVPQHCIQISELRASDPEWSQLFAHLAAAYEQAPNETLTKIRHLYGGMGSFSDVVLYTDDQVDRPGMKNLDEWRSGLYEQVVAEIIALRRQ